MMSRISEKLDAVQVPVGYSVAAGVGATPLWIQTLTGWLEFAAVLFAVLVGATTLWINVGRIIRGCRDDQADR